MNRILKTADIFSRPFSFSIGENKKKKQTSFGGILSLSVFIVSLIYLIYLMYMYFSNKFLPKVSKELITSTNMIQFQFSEPLFKFRVQVGKQTLEQYEKEKMKKFLSFSIIFERISSSSQNELDFLPTTDCSNDDSYIYTCMDIQSMTEKQRTFINDPGTTETNFAILVEKCIGSPECASESDIDALVNSIETNLYLYTGIQQFNVTSKEIQTKYIVQIFNFDSSLFLETLFSLKKSSTQIQSGLIIQSSEQIDYIVEYSKQDRYYFHTNALVKFQYSGYAYIGYSIDQNFYQNTIQFPQITEIITQFTSIFNILLMIGIIGNMVADSSIIHDLNNLWLKEYFKHTAINIVHKQKEEQILDNLKDQKPQPLLADLIFQQQESISSINFFENPQNYFRLSFISRLKLIIFGIEKVKETKQDNNINIYKQMTDFTNKQIDILELYKDIIQLKMAIKLILSEDQYAALQFCGRAVNQTKSPLPPSSNFNIPDSTPDQENKQIPHNSQHPQTIISHQNSPISSKQKINSQSILPIQVVNEQIRQSVISPDQQSDKNDQIEALNKNEYQRIEQQWKQINHLEQIDQIESTKEKLIDQLNRFLKKVEQKDNSLTQIDKNLYSSLIGRVSN